MTTITFLNFILAVIYSGAYSLTPVESRLWRPINAAMAMGNALAFISGVVA